MGKSSGMTLGDIAERLDLTCTGDASLRITGLGTLSGAGPGELSFLANPRYRSQLETTRAGALILRRDMAGATDLPALLADDPYLAFARATALFDTAPTLAGVHERAVVAESATLGQRVAVGANAVIGEGAVVGEDSVIHPGAVIGANVRIGARCVIFANVSIYHDVRLGDDVRVHSGAVIGGDGFGYARNPDSESDKGAWTKIHQLGSVVIGDRVEIGAGTTVDRGALDDTVIGNDVILDSQVIIAHNVVVGDGTAFAGRAAVAGSAVIGRNCTIAGGAGIVGHIELADGVHVAACTLVTRSILEEGASYSSGTPMMATADWRKSAVRFSQLETLSRRLGKLEKQLKD